jgi:DNA repair protein RecN (Recombination protein N)
MLRELRIRNLAVVEGVTVPFTPGLNVLTGETGAGKSILIDAILLVRGGRAQTDLIRAESDSAVVEAVFDVEERDGPIASLLQGAGLAPEDGQVVIRRELARSGRHRAFVNDSTVTVGLLERLGDLLVDVHGQHEHQRLLEPACQLELLDRFAEAEAERERVGALVGAYREARAELERWQVLERDRAQREDLLRFQVSELGAARLRPGEDEELRAERRRLASAERIAAGLAEAAGRLADDDTSVLAQLTRTTRLLGELARLDPDVAAPIARLDGARVEVEEALAALRPLRHRLEVEPGRLEAIDARLDVLVRLRRKYGDSEEAMLEFHRRAAEELARLERHDEVRVARERQLAELGAELAGAAGALSARRGSAAERLGSRVQRELRRLGMERAVFAVSVDRVDLEQISPRGLDRVEFRLSTNPGEELRPLARVASGGELSRTMLALSAILAAADRIPTIIFDEVDAGIGGRIAAVVAGALVAAAEGRQVLCVTHLAPIAARAGHHLLVAKSVRGGRTRVTSTALAGEARVAEIARLLSGAAVTGAALRHARELLTGAAPGESARV